MHSFQVIFAFAFTLVNVALVNACDGHAPTVQLGQTTLTGAAYLNGTVEFYGIPYAQPPIGSLRFKPPIQQDQPSVATLDATTFGSVCLQLLPIGPGSEDCLTVNVFRPGGLDKDAALPVMLWIHGGGYKLGSSASQFYNATGIISQSIARGTPVVYVSLNYRLGPLGFPPGREAAAKGALNLALQDQLTAVKWVNANIGAFGGDKNKVTIFGESAGSNAVYSLQANDKLKGLARAAILESGTGGLLPVFDAAHRQDDWDNFVKTLPPSCATQTNNVFGCLQNDKSNVSSADLLAAVLAANSASDEDYPWAPTLDGPNGFLPDIPSVLLKQGKFTRIPIILGNNLDEGTYFTTPLTNSTAFIRGHMVSNYTSRIASVGQVGAVADRLLELYPDVPALGSPFNTGNETFGLSSQYKRYAALLGDIMFQAPSRSVAQTFTGFGVPVYSYLFTGPVAHALSPPPLAGEPVGLANLGVMHTAEVPYVYNSTATFQEGDAAAALGRLMVDYWVSFATSLNPNDGRGIQRPNWAKYTLKDPMTLELNSNKTSLIPDTYRAAQISYINANTKVFSH
ncbi:extracellular triacylglycerol lipase precursor [Mycena amicta]|nr:extracellular triacylglycerol lipase precursor [Mycena amicta]